MNREEMIDKLVERDVKSIRDDICYYDDVSFLDAIIRGDGWKPYNQLTDEQIKLEYNTFFSE